MNQKTSHLEFWALNIALMAAIAVVTVLAAWIIVGGVIGHMDITRPIIHLQYAGHDWHRRGTAALHPASVWFKTFFTSLILLAYFCALGLALVVWWNTWVSPWLTRFD